MTLTITNGQHRLAAAVDTETEVETKTITIEPTPVQSTIQEMLDMTNKGHWIQGRARDGQGNYCTAGLVQKVLGWLK